MRYEEATPRDIDWSLTGIATIVALLVLLMGCGGSEPEDHRRSREALAPAHAPGFNCTVDYRNCAPGEKR